MLFVLLAAGSARGQHAGFTASDVPAGPGSIHGKVLHSERPDAAAGVEVVLYALPNSGAPGLRRTQTDAAGAFAFEGISNSPDVAYLVGARFAGLPFPGSRIAFSPGETDRTTEVRITDPTQDSSAVSVVESKVRLDRSAAGVAVVESHQLRNAGKRVVFVPVPARAKTEPAFAADFLPGAKDVTYPLGMKPDGLVEHPGGLRFFGPIYPGEQELTFSYNVPLEAGGARRLQKRFPSPAQRVLLLASQALGAVHAAGFAPTESAKDEDKSYRAFEAKRIPEGAVLDLALELPPTRTDPSALSVTEVRLVLDVDDAAVTVQEEHALRVAEGPPLLGSAAQPLLWIPLPAGTQDLRFGAENSAVDLVADERGGLDVIGPLPAGQSSLRIQYRVPVKSGAVTLDRTFGAAFPLLSVYVADSGITAESARLHRRRPVRTEDRAYLHLEAFEIAPGETVGLRLAALPPEAGFPRAAEVGLVGLLAAAAAALLAQPVLRRDRVAFELRQEAPDRRERESLYSALRDLEDDFETGKVAEADYRTLREELRGRALALLQAERDAERSASDPARASPGPPSPAPCRACGATPRPEDRFCGRCGVRLGPPAELEASA
jgi:cytochrome c-type biogenesis protein CcmI